MVILLYIPKSQAILLLFELHEAVHVKYILNLGKGFNKANIY